MIPSGLLPSSGVGAPSATYGSSCCAWLLGLVPIDADMAEAAPLTGDADMAEAGDCVETRTGAGCAAGWLPVKLLEPKMSSESARLA